MTAITSSEMQKLVLGYLATPKKHLIGGYKQSGWGREDGREGVEAYTEIKTVLVGL